MEHGRYCVPPVLACWAAKASADQLVQLLLQIPHATLGQESHPETPGELQPHSHQVPPAVVAPHLHPKRMPHSDHFHHLLLRPVLTHQLH